MPSWSRQSSNNGNTRRTRAWLPCAAMPLFFLYYSTREPFPGSGTGAWRSRSRSVRRPADPECREHLVKSLPRIITPFSPSMAHAVTPNLGNLLHPRGSMKRGHHAPPIAEENITTRGTMALSWRRVLTTETSRMTKARRGETCTNDQVRSLLAKSRCVKWKAK